VRAANGEQAVGRTKKRASTGPTQVVGSEVLGSDSFGRKSAADQIDVEYIQWGHSQKVQLAGVPCPGVCIDSISCRLLKHVLRRPGDGFRVPRMGPGRGFSVLTAKCIRAQPSVFCFRLEFEGPAQLKSTRCARVTWWTLLAVLIFLGHRHVVRSGVQLSGRFSGGTSGSLRIGRCLWFKYLGDALGYALMLPNRKSGFRAVFRLDFKR
jgi:hypothetical protein